MKVRYVVKKKLVFYSGPYIITEDFRAFYFPNGEDSGDPTLIRLKNVKPNEIKSEHHTVRNKGDMLEFLKLDIPFKCNGRKYYILGEASVIKVDKKLMFEY